MKLVRSALACFALAAAANAAPIAAAGEPQPARQQVEAAHQHALALRRLLAERESLRARGVTSAERSDLEARIARRFERLRAALGVSAREWVLLIDHESVDNHRRESAPVAHPTLDQLAGANPQPP